MSPFRSSAGPATVRMPTPSSSRTMNARLVLPRPGGPTRSTWSSASPRAFAASSAIASCSLTRSWPTKSSSRRGRSERSTSSSSGRSVGREELRSSCRPAAAPGGPAPRRQLGVDLGERPLGVDDGVAELDERVAGDEVSRRGSVALVTDRRLSSSTIRSAVFLPIPGIAWNRATSSRTIARRSSAGPRAGDDRQRDLRADAVHRRAAGRRARARPRRRSRRAAARPRGRAGTSRR